MKAARIQESPRSAASSPSRAAASLQTPCNVTRKQGSETTVLMATLSSALLQSSGRIAPDLKMPASLPSTTAAMAFTHSIAFAVTACPLATNSASKGAKECAQTIAARPQGFAVDRLSVKGCSPHLSSIHHGGDKCCWRSCALALARLSRTEALDSLRIASAPARKPTTASSNKLKMFFL
eukprot:6456770-Amphidinium_carterae.2